MAKPSEKAVDKLLVNEIAAFLDVSVNQFLFLSNVYPRGIFSKRSKYGAIVHRIRFKEIETYITTCIENTLPLIKHNLLKSFCIISVCKSGKPIEQLTIGMDDLKDTYNDLTRLQSLFQSCILKLNQNFETTSSFRPETFRIEIEIKENTRRAELFELQNQNFRFVDITNEKRKTYSVDAAAIHSEKISSCVSISLYKMTFGESD